MAIPTHHWNKNRTRFCHLCIVFLLTISCSNPKKDLTTGGEQSIRQDTVKILKRVSLIQDELIEAEVISKDIYDTIIEPDVKKIFRHGSSIITAYSKNNYVLKLSAHHEGDRESLISDFYFSNGSILFVKKTTKYFEPPKWDQNSKVVSESSVNYFFINEKLVTNKENNDSSLDQVRAQLEQQANSYQLLLGIAR